jgi:hypothetical protein
MQPSTVGQLAALSARLVPIPRVDHGRPPAVVLITVPRLPLARQVEGLEQPTDIKSSPTPES